MVSNANYTNCDYCGVCYDTDVSDSHDDFDELCHKED